jgi:hypothetical protein
MQQSLIAFLAIYSAFTFALPATAAEKAPSLTEITAPTPFEQPDKLGLEVGLKATNYSYSESAIADKGMLPGIGVAYQHGWDVGAVRGEVDYYAGNVTYDGEYSDGTKVQKTSSNRISELRGLWVGNIPSGNVALFGYHAGVGTRNSHEKSDGRGTYTRDTTYLYLPVGLSTAIPMGETGWSIGAAIEYDLFLAGENNSKLSEVGRNFKDITVEQTNGFGVRLTTEVRKDFGNWALKVQPYYTHWNIGTSSSALGYDDGMGTRRYFVEPDNQTSMLGLNVAAEM